MKIQYSVQIDTERYLEAYFDSVEEFTVSLEEAAGIGKQKIQEDDKG